MESRLSYEDSIERLRQIGFLDEDESPSMPDRSPQYDDGDPLGLHFFRTMIEAEDLGGLTLPRTYFARSRIIGTRFANTDLSQSTMCCNDFVGVDFSGATLAQSDMRASNFENCNFDNADLSGCDLRGSSLEGCTFNNTNLVGAVLAKKQGSAFSLWRRSVALTKDQKATVDWRKDEGDGPPGG